MIWIWDLNQDFLVLFVLWRLTWWFWYHMNGVYLLCLGCSINSISDCIIPYCVITSNLWYNYAPSCVLCNEWKLCDIQVTECNFAYNDDKTREFLAKLYIHVAVHYLLDNKVINYNAPLPYRDLISKPISMLSSNGRSFIQGESTIFI